MPQGTRVGRKLDEWETLMGAAEFCRNRQRGDDTKKGEEYYSELKIDSDDNTEFKDLVWCALALKHIFYSNQ